MNKPYNIGLDIGTTSVGWAVVEKETSKVMKKGKKSLWGVRLFDEATTASGRRGFRSTRRRYDRRRERIRLLQEEFKNEIEKVDPNFYKKLNESFYLESDIENKKNPLSKEEKEMIKEYHKKYPTIYHLRQALIDNNEKLDIRLVYLAIHHIIKYRGNFLYEKSEFSVKDLNISEKVKNVFENIASLYEEIGLEDYHVDNIDFKKIESVLLEPSKNDRKVHLKEELDPFFNASKEAKNALSELIKLLLGYKFSIMKLFNIELEKDITISLDGSDFDDKYDDLNSALSLKIETLSLMKDLYDTIFLKTLFGNRENSSLSSLMIDYYKEHEHDLKFLKKILNYNREEYRRIFKTNNKYTCVYDEYIHNKKSYDEFIKELNKSLEKVLDLANEELLSQYTGDIQKKIILGTFLPRITSTSNGKYPYQLNKSELEIIIENQGKHYPFLKEKINDENKLLKLLSFKIPYYIGPLVDSEKSKFAWMIRKRGCEKVKITPYNFEEVVDTQTSAEKFITRMLGHCSYLLDEPAMPSNSILYSEYKVLNELKQIRVNNEPLTLEFQHIVMNDFFKKECGSLTDKKFQNFLIHSREFDMYKGELSVTGYSADGKFANNMNSYIDFYGENGLFKNTNLKIADAENIIRWITIFEDKDILAKKIENEYPVLKSVIPKIIKKRYTGWSSLSEKLLTTPYYFDEVTSTKKSIMDLMWETKNNFMQIITDDKYNFQQMIADENSKEKAPILNYKLIENLSTSPSTKRGIWQALKVVEEIVDYIGYEPNSISIEMARGDEKKQRKDDRKKYLSKLYEKAKETTGDYNRLLKELNSQEKIDSEKLFLYFIQEGKSLYSATPLDINRLSEYEVDHILPRTLIKNDSIDNKALVLKEENQNKAANLVLPDAFQKNKTWWEHLLKNGLISRFKFYNLIRKKYKEEEIEGFINRQLVETRQITKHVANIIQQLHKDSKIIYIPASLSHNYREKFELYKFRDLNDYHHAHDAYLAAVLGEYKEHCNLRWNYDALKELNKELYDNGKYKELKYGFVINSIDPSFEHFNSKTGEVFDVEKFKETVENTLYRNDILISRKTEIKTGKYFKETILPKKIGTIEIKNNLSTEQYGGYTSIFPSYLSLIEYGKKKKIIGIPIMIKSQEKLNKSIKNYFIQKHLNIKLYSDNMIKKDMIPFETMILYKEQLVYLKGYSTSHKNCELANAVELKIPKEKMKKWKYILNKILNKRKIPDNKQLSLEELRKGSLEILYFLLEKKLEYPLLCKEIDKIKEHIDIEKLAQNEIEQIIVEIVKMYSCSSLNANLSAFGLGDRMGRLSGYNVDSGIIINKSVTGLRTRKYEF